MKGTKDELASQHIATIKVDLFVFSVKTSLVDINYL